MSMWLYMQFFSSAIDTLQTLVVGSVKEFSQNGLQGLA